MDAHPHQTPDLVAYGRAVIRAEADALVALAGALGEEFARAVRVILEADGRLVVGGLGKSGHVARKVAATFMSTGTPATFLHLSEAIHGDLGLVRPGDAALLLSQSGETPELVPVLHHLRGLGVPTIGVSAGPASPLSKGATVPLVLPALAEAGPDAVAPTTSTTMALALGDALAMVVMRARGFGRAEFRRLHPGGALGSRLSPVASVMHAGAAMPLAPPAMAMMEAVVEMTAKRLGVLGVVDDDGLLAGVVTDGDLRRHMAALAGATVGDVMSTGPQVVLPETVVDDALAILSRHKITSLFVVDDLARPRPLGVVHIHDLPYARNAS